MLEIKEAAVAIIIKDGLILAISRKDDPTKYGLPGGKRDSNESLAQCLTREVLEETGLQIHAATKVYERVEPPNKPDGLSFYSICYYVNYWIGVPQSLEGTIVKWVKPSFLTSSESGAFHSYNEEAFETFRKLFPNITLNGDSYEF